MNNRNNAFENEKVEKKKTLERFPDRTPHKNTGLNLCLPLYIKSLLSFFIYSLFKLPYD